MSSARWDIFKSARDAVLAGTSGTLGGRVDSDSPRDIDRDTPLPVATIIFGDDTPVEESNDVEMRSFTLDIAIFGATRLQVEDASVEVEKSLFTLLATRNGNYVSTRSGVSGEGRAVVFWALITYRFEYAISFGDPSQER